MEKHRILINLYRFIDILILFFLIFDFGFTINDNYKPYKLVGFFVIVTLIIFNVITNFQFKDSSSRKSVRLNITILLLTLIAATSFIFYNKHYFIVETINTIVVFEVGLFFYLLVRLSFLIKYIYKIYFNPAMLFIGSFGVFSISRLILAILFPK